MISEKYAMLSLGPAYSFISISLSLALHVIGKDRSLFWTEVPTVSPLAALRAGSEPLLS